MTRKKRILRLILFLLFLALILFIVCSGKRFVDNYREEKHQELSISGGIVPHHLLAKDIIDKFFQYLSKENKENIVILSPDHFDISVLTGSSYIGVSSEEERFLDCPINTALLNSMDSLNLTHNSGAVAADHGISNLTPFVKKYLPESKILPLLISPRATAVEIEELIQILNRISEANPIVIASVDFSHYLPRAVAEFHDVKSISTLVDFRKEAFLNLEVDSWQALYGARLFARLKAMEKVRIIGRGGSWDYVGGGTTGENEETTSYFSVIFQNTSQGPETDKGKTMLFVGNVILDGSVAILINENTELYPFQKIERFLRGVDLVIGNLEGPTTFAPNDSPEDPPNFNFLPEIAEGLSWSHFNLLSIANNYALNREGQGLVETKEVLEKWSINYLGDPITYGAESIDETGGVVFLSFNQTLPQNYSDTQILTLISETRTTKSDSFIIAIIRWGEEGGLPTSTKQRRLAHKIIAAGADMIVGYCSHVIQDIEIYENKPIFYSLGNFILAPPPPEESQEGLVIGVELYENQAKYHLFPIKISQSQPLLVTGVERREFLQRLAGRNKSRLYDSIKNGILETKR
ncbi:AmmeMemoRadiSam system protein B [Patescibacteria group bacterium]